MFTLVLKSYTSLRKQHTVFCDTPHLPESGKYVIIVLMFVGRVGTMTAASALAMRERRRVIRMPEASPMIG